MLEQLLQRIRANDPTLTKINLRKNDIGAEGAQALAEALKQNKTVTQIDLSRNKIGAEGAQALADALKINKTVTQIGLRGNEIGYQGAQALAEALKINQTVTQINLNDNNIGAQGAQALAEALKQNQTVTRITLAFKQIGNEGAQALAEALKENKTVTQIDLSNNTIGYQGAQALAEALKINKTVTQIYLSSNQIGAQGAQALAEALKQNQTVTQISLDGNIIGARGAQALAEALKINQTVTQINLERTYIGAEGAQALAEALKQNQTLTQIDLSRSEIGAQGVQALGAIFTAVYLKNSSLLGRIRANDPTLRKINLSFNQIGAQGAQALAEALKVNQTVTKINLSCNQIGAEGAQALAEALKINKTVTQIGLSFNQIGAQGAQALADALKINKTVTQINLESNQIGDEGAQALADALKINKTVTQIGLRGNEIGYQGAQALAEALVQNLLKQDVSVNYQDEDGNTAFPAESLVMVKEPTKSWHFAEHLLEQANEMENGNGFALVPADVEDIGKVIQFYGHHPVPGYDLKRIEIIYNRGQNQIFERRLKLLDDRAHPASADGFAPQWSKENSAGWRAKVDEMSRNMANPYQDPSFLNVKLLPMWHGTKDNVLESILRTGYANLAKTDGGFFGKGIYTTAEAEYAFRVYSMKNGPLVLNWVAFFSAYPTIDGDMAKLAEKANYQNYDAHFVPVVPASNKPDEVNYCPTIPNQNHTYTELVVFDSNHCLPRYLVELQPTLPKAPVNLGGSPHSLFFKGKVGDIIYVNLLAAAKYAYDNHLAKSYTLEEGPDWQMDWEYRHPSNGKIVPRPNHGLAHTLRKLLYLPRVLEHYIAHQKLSEHEAKLLKNDIKVMQLALLFFISGRENDLGSQGNEANFHRFRKQSADNFERYVKEAGIKLSSEKILEYKEAMRWFDNPEDKGPLKHIRQLLWQCHFIDLIRCLTPEQFNGVIGYVDKNIGQARREQLIKLAQISIEKTGDRLLAMEPKRGYQADLFVDASTSAENCMKYLQTAYREFETKVQAQPVSITAPKPGK